MKSPTSFSRLLSLFAATLLVPAALFAQPVVSNVAYVQQPDGAGSTEVVVTYDLASPNGDATVSLLYSTDGGASFSTATTTTGAVGAGVAPGTGKTIDWAVATDLPGQQLSGDFVVRVLAEDGVAIPLAITSTLAEDSVTQTASQTFTFTFDEPITGFDDSDVTVTGGTKGTFTPVSATVYTLDVTGTGGTVMASVAADAASSIASGTTTLGDSYSNFYQDTRIINLPGDVPMELIRIPAGTFVMGSPAGPTPPAELSRNPDEVERTITLTQDFYLGKTEVTQAQWLAIYGSFPDGGQSHGTGAGSENRAVHRVSHNDIMDASTGFMKLLNDHITGTSQGPATATLPTEAQWEYACRAGTTTRFNFGDGTSTDEDCATGGGREDNMWYCGNSSSSTQLVGQKPANAWGLRDMHGNVWEWCADWYDTYDTLDTENPTGATSGSFRVIRGGGWDDNVRVCRSAYRGGNHPSNLYSGLGFRVRVTSSLDFISVPAGTFTMGRTASGDDATDGEADELPNHEVTLSAYDIGKYEVSNEQFATVMNWALAQGHLADDSSGAPYAGGGNVYLMAPDATATRQPLFNTVAGAMYSQIEWTGSSFAPLTRDSKSMGDYPVVMVTWYGSVAYCNFLAEMEGKPAACSMSTWGLVDADPVAPGLQYVASYRLPTESEWERAAAWDGSKHWIYSFLSDTLTGVNRANYNNSNPMGLTSWCYLSPTRWFNGVNESPNGSVPTVNSPSPMGAYDMSGNVSEWCHDWYGSYTSTPKTDPTGAAPGTYRVVRGGSWDLAAEECRSARRVPIDPEAGNWNVGFRVLAVR